MSEPLDEKTLEEWRNSYDEYGSCRYVQDRLIQVIDALRAARQELAITDRFDVVISPREAERRLVNQARTIEDATKRISELEQQLAVEHSRAESLQKSLLDEMCKS